jgi:hypothetical protein
MTPAEILDPAEIGEAFLFHPVGQRFDKVRAAERIDRIGDAALLSNDLLGAQSDGDGFFGGERQRFVHRIGVERLTAAKDGGERLDSGANDVILRLLRRERASCRLCVEAQPERARIPRAEALLQRARARCAARRGISPLPRTDRCAR